MLPAGKVVYFVIPQTVNLPHGPMVLQAREQLVIVLSDVTHHEVLHVVRYLVHGARGNTRAAKAKADAEQPTSAEHIPANRATAHDS